MQKVSEYKNTVDHNYLLLVRNFDAKLFFDILHDFTLSKHIMMVCHAERSSSAVN